MWRVWIGFTSILALLLGFDYYNYHLLMTGQIESNFMRLSWAALDSARYKQMGTLGYSGRLTWWEHANLLGPFCAALFGALFGYLRHKKVEAQKEVEEIYADMIKKKFK